jgi:hypothetical protein
MSQEAINCAACESAAVTLHDAIYSAIKEGKLLHEHHSEQLYECWLRLNATLYDEPLSPRRIVWLSNNDTISEIRWTADYAAGVQGKPERLFRAVRLSAQRARKALGS